MPAIDVAIRFVVTLIHVIIFALSCYVASFLAILIILGLSGGREYSMILAFGFPMFYGIPLSIIGGIILVLRVRLIARMFIISVVYLLALYMIQHQSEAFVITADILLWASNMMMHVVFEKIRRST